MADAESLARPRGAVDPGMDGLGIGHLPEEAGPDLLQVRLAENGRSFLAQERGWIDDQRSRHVVTCRQPVIKLGWGQRAGRAGAEREQELERRRLRT